VTLIVSLWRRLAGLQAEVVVVDHVVDAASGFFGVRLKLPNTDNSIRAGLECTIRFGVGGGIVAPQN